MKEKNFFISNNDYLPVTTSESYRRMNDYDYNILPNIAYKSVGNEYLQLEYQISLIEKELKILNNQIQVSRDINDYDKVEAFLLRKEFLENKREDLLNRYNSKSLSAKVSDTLVSFFTPNIRSSFSEIKSKMFNITNHILSKLPKRFLSIIDMQQSLNKLENINKSIDELISMQTPYGEASEKYTQLSKYIVKANSLHSKISKNLR